MLRTTRTEQAAGELVYADLLPGASHVLAGQAECVQVWNALETTLLDACYAAVLCKAQAVIVLLAPDSLCCLLNTCCPVRGSLVAVCCWMLESKRHTPACGRWQQRCKPRACGCVPLAQLHFALMGSCWPRKEARSPGHCIAITPATRPILACQITLYLP